MTNSEANYEYIQRGLEKLKSALEVEEETMKKAGIKNLQQRFQEYNNNWLSIIRSIQALVGKLPNPHFIWLPHEDVGEFIQEINNSDREFYLVSGSLNPEIGILGNPKAIGAIHEKLISNPNFLVKIIFGSKIMLKNNTNPFISFWIDRKKELPSNLELYTYANRIYSADNATVLEEFRPPFHCKILDNHNLTYEYPHFEFEHARQRVTLSGDQILKIEEIVSMIKEFYESRTKRVSSVEDLPKLIEDSRTVDSYITY